MHYRRCAARSRAPGKRASNCVSLRRTTPRSIEALSELTASRETTKVTDHLRHSRAVVAAQLLADAGDDGLTAAVTFLVGFAERCDGMIQADGTGFFEGEELIVELD